MSAPGREEHDEVRGALDPVREHVGRVQVLGVWVLPVPAVGRGPLITLLVRCFLSLQATQPFPQNRHQTQQQPKQTDPRQAGPCWLSSICVLLPSNKDAGSPGVPSLKEYGGALALCCPFFQHFLFHSGFSASILVKNSRDGARSPRQDLPCWSGRGHIGQNWILNLYTRLGQFVPACPGPGMTLTLLSNLSGT